jgi:hypothetical protein
MSAGSSRRCEMDCVKPDDVAGLDQIRVRHGRARITRHVCVAVAGEETRFVPQSRRPG